jgi:hypothetical protein
MSVIVIGGAARFGAEILQPMQEAGVVDQLGKAPGFQGHWSGPSGRNYKVIELWESPEAYWAWIDGTIRPNLPAGAQLTEPEFIDLALAVEPG